MRKEVTVAVTGFEASSKSQASAAICRCLRDSVSFEGKIIGLVTDPYSAAAHVPGLLDGAYQVTSPAVGRGKFLADLIDVDERCGIDVLIVGPEADYPHIYREEMEALGIQTLLPDVTARESISRGNLLSLARDLHLDIPATTVAETLPMVWAQAAAVGYPCFIKATRDSRSVATHTPEETTIIHGSLLAGGYQPVLVQGMIRGETITVHGLASQGGGWVGGGAVKKIAPTHSGSTWGGVSVEMPALLHIAETIVRFSGWTGPIEIDFLHQEEIGRCSLIDIRPGYGSMVSFLHPAGVNLPELGVRLALGEKISATPAPIPGILTFRYAEDLVTDIGSFAAFSVTREVQHYAHDN
jgi:hypothetical protein